jgi:hypothetical protein
MKKLFVAILALITVSASAQTVDEIISKYAATMGGLDAYNKVTTAKLTGTYSIQGNDLALTVQLVNGKSMRSDVEAMGQAVVNVYYNAKGWKVNPFAGVPDPVDVTGSELSDFKQQSYFAPQLMDYKARGFEVALDGKETVEGIETYKIKVTNKEDGRITYYSISTKDYTMIRSVTTREIQGQQVNIESWFSDLKDIGNGMKFFMTRDAKMDGQVIQTVKYDKIELNVPIDEKIFERK